MDTQNTIQQRLVDMAEENGAFRSQLIADPRSAIRESLDVELPDDFNVVVHEEDAKTAAPGAAAFERAVRCPA